MTIFNDKDVKEETAESLMEIFGDTDAVMFCMQLLYVYHAHDDLIDGDERTQEDLNRAFSLSMVEIRRNPFFMRFQHELQPLITSSVLQWFDANTLESERQKGDLNKAYMLRAFIIQIWAYCAYLIHGIDAYHTLGPVMQRMYQEDFDLYVEEMNNA